MLVIRTSDGNIRWMNVPEYLRTYFAEQGEQAKQIEFEGEAFTADNLARLRDRLMPRSS